MPLDAYADYQTTKSVLQVKNFELFKNTVTKKSSDASGAQRYGATDIMKLANKTAFSTPYSRHVSSELGKINEEGNSSNISSIKMLPSIYPEVQLTKQLYKNINIAVKTVNSGLSR